MSKDVIRKYSNGNTLKTVPDLPEEKPIVEGALQKYEPGDLVAVNCTSAPSKPAAHLVWYINGKEVREH